MEYRELNDIFIMEETKRYLLIGVILLLKQYLTILKNPWFFSVKTGLIMMHV